MKEDSRIEKRLFKIAEWGLQYSTNPHVGYVYLLKPTHHNVFKIGCTTDLDRRLKTFQKTRNYKLEYVAAIWVDDCEELERYMHRKYKQYHLIGEWFVLPPSTVDQFVIWGES